MLKKIVENIYSVHRKHKYQKKLNCTFESNTLISYKSSFEGYNKIGKNSNITQSHIGYATYVGEGSKLIKTHVGKYSSIGPDVQCLIGKHPTDTFVSIHPAFYSLREQCGMTYVKKQLFEESVPTNDFSILIGNDVWIGGHVRILDGVTIGDGAIIAAGSIVTKSVEPYSIVGGVPAKLIKWRFTKEQIELLKSFKWWDKEETWIKENVDIFSDIVTFVKTVRRG